MTPTHLSAIGTGLIISASVIAITGAYINNCWLDHILAMRVWRFSNILWFGWSVGLYRKWWCGGLPALGMVGTYAVYGITNEMGLDGWGVP